MSTFKKLKEKFENKKNIVRVQKNKDNPYVMINKSCLNDDNLTWAAKGLHSYLLSLPDDWEIYVKELVKHTSAGRDHTYTIIKELLKHGYMQKTEYRYKGKVLALNYTVFEVSTGEDNTKSKISNVDLNNNGEIVDITSLEPNPENPYTDMPDTDYTTLLNNNYNKIINKQNNDSVVVVSEKETKLLELYKSYKIEKRIMPQTKKLLNQYIDKFDLEVFEQIFISASEDSIKKKYSYMKKVFEELVNKNIKTLVEFEEDNKKYEESKKTKAKNFKVKTRFHNINDHTQKYTAKELEQLLKENQKRKFDKEKELEMKKTSFHNFNQTIDKYTEYELNELISKSQKNKFGIDGTSFMSKIEITNELIKKCIMDESYFNSLNENIKHDIKKYMIENNKFIPLHIKLIK